MMDFFLLLNDVLLEVMVVDDGLPVTESKTITLSLMTSSRGSDDVFKDEAELIIPGPQGKQLTVMCPSMHSKDYGIA